MNQAKNQRENKWQAYLCLPPSFTLVFSDPEGGGDMFLRNVE
jgi:hypothetical protein